MSPARLNAERVIEPPESTGAGEVVHYRAPGQLDVATMCGATTWGLTSTGSHGGRAWTPKLTRRAVTCLACLSVGEWAVAATSSPKPSRSTPE